MKKTLFIRNAAYLTTSSLILRFAGIVFKIWLAAKIGAEGIGLYQLVFSVFILASSFSQSGIPTAVTRLVAEESALGGKSGIKNAVGVCLKIGFAVGALSALVLLFCSELIADKIIADPRAALSLRLLGLAVLFSGGASVMKGYFIARRNAAPNAVSGLIEQFVRIAAVVPAISLVSRSVSKAVALVFLGDGLSLAMSLAYLLWRFSGDCKKLPEGERTYNRRPVLRTVKIALPLAAGRYIGQLLRTAENLLVPRALSARSGDGALSLFGMIKGMALPVLFFPSAMLGAVSSLLVPEMSEAGAKRKTLAVRRTVERILSAAATVGIMFSAIFSVCGYELGRLLYKSADVGFLLVSLAPIVPLMYVDSLCDGLLRGLNQQRFCFHLSVSDSALRIILILLFVGRFGIHGFIGIMYFSNLLTCLLSVKRLKKISGAAFNAQKTVVIPVAAAFSVTLLIRLILRALCLSDLVYIITLSVISSLLFFLLLYYFGCVNLESVGRIRTHKKYAAKTTATSFIK